MTPEEAVTVAQSLATKLVDDHLEAKPCIGLLDIDGLLNTVDDDQYDHPVPLLRAAAAVEGSPWVGVVVVCEGTARRIEDGSGEEVEIGRAQVITACFGAKWWDQLILSPAGVHRSTERPVGDIPDAMAAAVRRPPVELDR